MEFKRFCKHLIKRIKKECKNQSIIVVTGYGSSGKTQICKTICKIDKDFCHFNTDGYLVDWKKRTGKGITGAHPIALKKKILDSDIKKMRQGLTINMKCDKINKEFKSNTFKPKKIILIDGILSIIINKELIDYKIMVLCDKKVELLRRLHRDIHERSFSKDYIIKTVTLRRKQFDEHILPRKKECDMIIKSNEDYSINILNEK